MRARQHYQRILSLLLALALSLTWVPEALAESATAATMQLMKTEGTVDVSNSRGRSISMMERMRLYNGYQVETQEASYAWINLDDAKLIKLDAVSKAGLRKSGRNLEILLHSGNLLFNVTEPLEDDESMNIRTSTMVVGVRGTCGWVKAIDQWTTVLYILEGSVTCSVTDPVTGEVKTEVVTGGQRATCVVYPQDQAGSKCDIILDQFEEGDVDGFVLVDAVPDGPLCEKIYADSGLDLRDWTGDPQDRLEQDESSVHEKLEVINGALENQDRNISVDPVWKDNGETSNPTETTGPSTGGNGPVTGPSNPSEVVTLTMPQEDDTVDQYLSRAQVRQVILLPGTARASTVDMLEVDSGLSVPLGKILTLDRGVGMTVLSGQTLRADGTLQVKGGLYIAGTMTAGGRVTVDGTLSVTGTLAPTTGAVIKAINFNLAAAVPGWKVSDTADANGYYTLVRDTGNPDDDIVGEDWWTLNRTTGLLTISCQGNMDDYFDNGGRLIAPWASDAAKVVTVIVEAGATKLGTAAFQDCVNLTKVTLPNTIQTIGISAFRGCSSLTSVAVPASVTTIESMAFSLCTKLASIAIPSGVTQIASDLFSGCTSLTRVDIPGTVTSIIPSAFSGCTALTDIYFDDTRDQWNAIGYTPAAGVTVHCIDDGEGRDDIVGGDWWTLNRTTGFLTISCQGRAEDFYEITSQPPWKEYLEEITDANVSEGVTSLEFAFNGCSNLTSVTLPSTLTQTGDAAFQNCTSLTSVTLPGSVQIIEGYAFNGCTSLTRVDIPGAVTSILTTAFNNCTALKDIYFDGTQAKWDAIGYTPAAGVTVHCTDDGDSDIVGDDWWTLNRATGLLTVSCTGNMDDLFVDGKYLIAPWEGGGYAEEVVTAVVEAGPTKLGSGAFKNCVNLTKVTLPNTIQTIGGNAFRDCSSLPSVAIPDSVTTIETNAFNGCTKLTSVAIPSGVTKLENSLFFGCTSLTQVDIPGTVTSILSTAFTGCTALTDIYFDGTRAKWDAIGYTPAAGVTVHCIDDGGDIVSGDWWTLNRTTGLLTISCQGKAEDFYETANTPPWVDYLEEIKTAKVSEGVTSLGCAFHNYRSAIATCNLTSISLPSTLSQTGDSAFYGCASLTSVNLPDGVRIGSNAFRGCTSLASITIPDSASIGTYAFMNSGLRTLTIPGSATIGGQYVFTGCENLTSVTFEPRSRAAITLPMGVFSKCTSLREVIFPEGHYLSFPDQDCTNAFSGCTSLTSFTIPEGTGSIGAQTFEGAGLTSITLPSTLVSIGMSAFNRCASLASVTFPVSCKSVSSYAFDDCTALTDVYYTGTEEQWNAINFNSGNLPLRNATIHYNSAARSARSGSAGFEDVDENAWYAEAVAYCLENGLMGGASETEFAPNAPMTRAMLAAVLYRLAGSPAGESASAFPDVESGAWYAPAVSWALREGVMGGYANGLFGPEDPVTREQTAAILWRFAGEPASPAGQDFADESQISSYAAKAVDWAQSAGILNGRAGNRFEPAATATRAETATVLMHYVQGREGLSELSAIDALCGPSGIAAAPDGSLLVTDLYNKRIWTLQSGSSGFYAGGQTVAGLYGEPLGGYNDAALADSYFKQPWAIAPFLGGWAVSDTENNVIRLIRGDTAQTLNSTSRNTAAVTGMKFDHPTGLAADGAGNLYVADTFSGKIYQITTEGKSSVYASGLEEPMGLCWANGALYVAESGANRVVRIVSGRISVVAGSGEEGFADGSASQASFSGPQGVAVGADGTVYVSDTGNSAVRQVRDGQVTTLAARDTTQVGHGLVAPTNLLVQGNLLYICDSFAKKVFVLQLG